MPAIRSRLGWGGSRRGAGEQGPGGLSGRRRRGIVSRSLHVLHDAVGLVNFGRATLEHLIPKTGG